MTREEILAMKPGRELDALVAKTLFNGQIITKQSTLSDKTFYALVGGEKEGFNPLEKGKTLRTVWWRHTEEQAWQACPDYSTDISAAWEVVDEMNGKYGFFIQRLGDYFDEGTDWEGWECSFGGQSSRLIKAKTVPEAVCKAALIAVLGEGETA